MDNERWVVALRHDGSVWEEFLAFLEEFKQESARAEHNAKTWDEYNQAKGAVNKVDDLIHRITIDLKEAQAYAARRREDSTRREVAPVRPR